MGSRLALRSHQNSTGRSPRRPLHGGTQFGLTRMKLPPWRRTFFCFLLVGREQRAIEGVHVQLPWEGLSTCTTIKHKAPVGCQGGCPRIATVINGLKRSLSQLNGRLIGTVVAGMVICVACCCWTTIPKENKKNNVHVFAIFVIRKQNHVDTGHWFLSFPVVLKRY